jgi:hypothetical protein
MAKKSHLCPRYCKRVTTRGRQEKRQHTSHIAVIARLDRAIQ